MVLTNVVLGHDAHFLPTGESCPSRLAVKSGDFKSPIIPPPAGSRGFESRLGLDFLFLVIRKIKMRPIKFRAWNFTEKKMFYNAYLYP